MMAEIQARCRRSALTCVVFTSVLAACGDSGPDGIPEDDPLASRTGQGRRASGGGEEAREEADDAARGQTHAFASYDKVPGELRRPFTEDAFRSDPDGDENRDPFRSYIVDHPRSDRDDDDFRTELCGADNSAADAYPHQDLELTGIVLRGTRGYALFRDRQGASHIVNRGDCIGSDKALITNIGSNYVQLALGADDAREEGTEPEEKPILLHPDAEDPDLLPDDLPER